MSGTGGGGGGSVGSGSKGWCTRADLFRPKVPPRSSEEGGLAGGMGRAPVGKGGE